MIEQTMIGRHRLLFAIALALVFSLLAAGDDVTIAAPWSQGGWSQGGGGGFFGQLFGAPPPSNQNPYYNRRQNRSSNPFLGGQDQSFFSPFQPFVRKPPPAPKLQQPSVPPVATVEVKPKDPKARKILVIGDFLAGGLAWGLDQELADEPKLAVVDKSKDLSGLVRDDYFDWNKSLPDILNSEKPDLVVILLGANDRQQMRTGNQRIAIGSDTWEKTYTQRVEGIVDTLKVYGRPFFWMSAPPMRTGSTAGDATYLNGIYKPRVEAGGGTFVDVWNGFTNADGQYIGWGPDKDGQVRQLRTADGINFTGAGRLKLAFYAEREVRRKTGVGAGTVDLLPSSSQQTRLEIGPDGKKRLVGPVISLSDPLPGGSDTLAGGPAGPAAPAADSPQSNMIDQGTALRSIPGRIDDYVWPPRPAEVPTPMAEAAPAPASQPVKPAKTALPAGSDKPAVLTPISKAN
jgi:hypothetical protein